MNLPSSLVADPKKSKVERPDHATPIAEIVAALSIIEDLKGLTPEEFTWLAIHGRRGLLRMETLSLAKELPRNT